MGKLRKVSLMAAGVGGLLLLAGCALTGQQLDRLEETLMEMVASGSMTWEQANAIMLAVQDATNSATDWVEHVTTAAVTLFLGYFGIQRWRGPVSQRRGLPPMPAPPVMTATPVPPTATQPQP